MLSALRVLAFIPLVLVSKIRRDERRLVDWFRARGALDADRAVTVYSEGRVAAWVHQRLVRAGAIRPAEARYYLDEASYTAFRGRRRKRALVLILLVIALAIASYFMGDASV